jgi:diadenosine tetraphosphate (Ap4A) HIT family hydrolase
MTLDRIWNGWRAEYVGAASDAAGTPQVPTTASVFTQILESGLSDEDAFIVHRSTLCFAILNAFPYASGHVLVLPYREVAQLEDLTADESLDLWATVTEATQALRQSHKPHALNVGINLGAAAGGSIAQHLHVHIVPRWNGDANFMTSVASARTIPEPLPLTASKVRQAWPKGNK